MEPYFRPTDDGPTPDWHPVSKESLIEPQVETITVRIRCLESWEELWVELNRDCIDTKNDPRRPRAQDAQLKVTASGAFLTVQEYVSAVHPWLMGMRERLLDALGNIYDRPSAETKLAVLQFGVGPLSIGYVDRWAYWHRKSEPVARLSEVEREEASRKVMERYKARSAERVRELERLRQENN
ncbi:uncharacterized protein CTRU02_211502 [Colletotrichum truncatum]|uniref:Uncharacterized protein n=1 Tax=Colletotrichum truncatum TaxID=5467 RepID=A0ACC3YKW6_COLTU|nr:uncharacterized protein CTRU02_13873 [Colletotrichum truncatum]KAF6782875.1 hypothetical protein CTRU02_13873 [Colletotrichum truncatum]